MIEKSRERRSTKPPVSEFHCEVHSFPHIIIYIMDSGIISMRYAKALLCFAKENKEEELVYAEVKKLAEAFVAVPDFKRALLNPILSEEKKNKLVLAAACNEAKPSHTLARFTKLLLEKKRAEQLQLVALTYADLYRKEQGITLGRLTVPSPISKELREHLQKWIEKKAQSKVSLEVKENPDIIGGFILEYDNQQFDASVKTQLNKIRRALQ